MCHSFHSGKFSFVSGFCLLLALFGAKCNCIIFLEIPLLEKSTVFLPHSLQEGRSRNLLFFLHSSFLRVYSLCLQITNQDALNTDFTDCHYKYIDRANMC